MCGNNEVELLFIQLTIYAEEIHSTDMKGQKSFQGLNKSPLMNDSDSQGVFSLHLDSTSVTKCARIFQDSVFVKALQQGDTILN